MSALAAALLVLLLVATGSFYVAGGMSGDVALGTGRLWLLARSL